MSAVHPRTVVTAWSSEQGADKVQAAPDPVGDA
jgi:hypothetical protein